MATYTFTNAVVVETRGSGADIVWDQVTIRLTDGDDDNQLNRDNTDPGGDQAFVFESFNRVLASSFEPQLDFTYTSIDRAARGTGTLTDAAGNQIRGFWFEVENGNRDFRVFIPSEPNAGFDYVQNGNGFIENTATRDFSYGEVASPGDDQFVISDPDDGTARNWNMGEGDDLAQASAGADIISLGGGNDTAFGGGGNDTIAGGDGNDSILGEAGNDGLVGNAGDDTIRGGEGQDTIFGGAGADSLDGGAGNDSLDGGAEDASADTLEGGAGNDTLLGQGGDDVIDGGTGADSILAGEGADSVVGGDGNDTIQGGGGNDTLIGDGGSLDPVLTRERFNWSQLPDPNRANPIDNGDDLRAGGTQNTGSVDVTFAYTPARANSQFTFDTQNEFTAGIASGSETVNTNSGATLRGFAGGGESSRLEIAFAATAPGVEDEVRNVSFRINDIDEGSFRDQVTIRAFDAAGNLVDIRFGAGENLTLADTDGLSGADTGFARDGTDQFDADDPEASLLVTIPGPVARIEIVHGDRENSQHAIQITDIFFDAVTIPTAATTGNDSILGGEGDDSIEGGPGNDTLLGENGNDTILGGDGADSIDGGAGDDVIIGGPGSDTMRGGDDRDTFILDRNSGADLIFGGEGGVDFDRIVLSGGGYRVNFTNNDRSTESGAIDFLDADGNVIATTTFSEIEQVVCFAAGTMIRTPEGERPVETLRPGELVETMDSGPQPVRWAGRRIVPATGRFAPVRIRAGAFGSRRDLLVSQQHRMLVSGPRAELMFGAPEALAAAKHLADGESVTIEEGGVVEYVHILFDRHEIVFAEGAATESLHPGAAALSGIAPEGREEILALFPELAEAPDQACGGAARTILRAYEARAFARLAG